MCRGESPLSEYKAGVVKWHVRRRPRKILHRGYRGKAEENLRKTFTAETPRLRRGRRRAQRKATAREQQLRGNAFVLASWGAALRFGNAESRDESRCSAIHKQRPYRVGQSAAREDCGATRALW